MADYTKFPFNMFSDIDLIRMLKESRKLNDKDFVHAILVELGKRGKLKVNENEKST
jgi:hypothetical protein